MSPGRAAFAIEQARKSETFRLVARTDRHRILSAAGKYVALEPSTISSVRAEPWKWAKDVEHFDSLPVRSPGLLFDGDAFHDQRYIVDVPQS